VLIYCLGPAPAWAQPLNLADPTPRAIQLEFEISVDPGTVAQTYSEPFAATYSATGNTGTVVISRAEYEAAIQTRDLDYFDAMMTWSLIPGSASDFTLEIDLTTMEVAAQPLSYEIHITDPVPVPQNGTVTRYLSSTATAGFAFLPEFPGFPFFCATCTLVPGASYDPATGAINAVGSDDLVAPDIPSLTGFSRAGDLRLSETPAPVVPALSTYGRWGLAVWLMGFASLMIRRERRSNGTAAQQGAAADRATPCRNRSVSASGTGEGRSERGLGGQARQLSGHPLGGGTSQVRYQLARAVLEPVHPTSRPRELHRQDSQPQRDHHHRGARQHYHRHTEEQKRRPHHCNHDLPCCPVADGHNPPYHRHTSFCPASASHGPAHPGASRVDPGATATVALQWCPPTAAHHPNRRLTRHWS
jgi:hypothetical protein